jgi:hypothetical protein
MADTQRSGEPFSASLVTYVSRSTIQEGGSMRLYFALLAATAILIPAVASANRYIVVNGQILSPDLVVALDAAACTTVPSGRYWLLTDGAWGYEGVPVVAGYVGDQCNAGTTTPRRKSLSERGMLYSPHELLR